MRVVLTNNIYAGPIFSNNGYLATCTNQMTDHGLAKIIPANNHNVIFKTGTIKAQFFLLFQCAHKICELSDDKTINTQTGNKENEADDCTLISNRKLISITYGG